MDYLVSVIVPVYNVEKYLEECVDSIIHQTYKNLEIILVDDGSTDSSGKICDSYVKQDLRIKVIHKINGGLSDARNSGMRCANGKYIYFCDSDDYIDADTIEELVKIANDESAEAVFFNAIAFSTDGIACSSKSYLRKSDYKVATGTETAFRLLVLDEYKPCIPLHFYDKSFLDKNSLKFKKGIIGEDELFSFYVYLKAQKVVYCNNAYYHRRLREGSIMISSQTERRFDCYSQIYAEMRAVYDKADKASKKYCREYIDRIAKSLVLAYRNLSVEDENKYVKTYGEIKKDIVRNKGFGDLSLIVRLKAWHMGIGISGIRKYIRMRIHG